MFSGRYEVLAILGRGGMGTVYEVMDLSLQRRRALKVLHGHLAEQAHLRERFVLEAQLGGRIESPYLVDVVDAGFDADRGQLYLVMERLVGENLAQRLARLGPRPAAEVVGHLGQLALALDRMHERGVIHRDLKPANLFLHALEGEPERIKVLDLGIAKIVSGADSTTGTAGTPIYMAPEQLRGRGVGPATDVHALGQIAFTLLVGRSYWREADELDPIAFGLLAARGPVEAASRRAQVASVELPAAFDRWFARATAVEPSRRFASATSAVRELATALEVPVPDELLAARAEVLEAQRWDADPDPSTDVPLDSTAGATVATAAPVGTAPARSSGRARWAVLAGLAAAAGTVALVLRGPEPRSEPVVRAASPIGDGGTLACPILEVDDPDRDGWLGAAAAALVCERARVVLGGRPDRTRVPAELLALPTAPRDSFPTEPFAGAAARMRSVAAARLADAYVDGRVATTAAGFRLDLVLRAANGDVLERHRGEGVALVDAVRDAMAPMIHANGLPWAPVADPMVAAYTGTGDLRTQLALLDLTLAFAINAGQVGEACEAFRRAWPGTDPRFQFARYECAFTLGTRPPRVELPDAARTLGELTMRARIRHMIERTDLPGERDALIEAYQRSVSGWERSMLATTVSCLWENHSPAEARAWSTRAVEAEPKNPTGEWCAPWEQLMAVSFQTPSLPAVATAVQAWRPWHPYGWWTAVDPTGRLAERAYVLAPFNVQVAAARVASLVASGRRGDARRVAERLATSATPVHRLEAERLSALLDADETHFDSALTRARGAMRVQPGDAGWVFAQRLAAAELAVQLAEALEDPAVATEAAAQLLAAEKTVMEPVNLEGLYRLAMICGHASREVADRCFAAMPTPQADVDTTSAVRVGAFIDGARAYARGDTARAARAWRPIVRDDALAVQLMAAPMVDVFTAVREPAFVQLVVERGPKWNGGSVAMARAALAFARDGDRAMARTWARTVREAWKMSSVAVPLARRLEEVAR